MGEGGCLVSRELFANSAAYPRMRAWKCERVGPIEDKLFLFGGVPGSIYPKELVVTTLFGDLFAPRGVGREVEPDERFLLFF